MWNALLNNAKAVFALSVFAGGEGATVLIALANSEDHEDIRLEVFDGLRSLWSRLAPNRPITTNLSNPQAWIPILTPNGSECRLENERRVEAEEERERFAASLMQAGRRSTTCFQKGNVPANFVMICLRTCLQ